MSDSKTHTSQCCVSALLAVALLTATMFLPCAAPSQGYAQEASDGSTEISDGEIEYMDLAELGVKPEQFHVDYEVVRSTEAEIADVYQVADQVFLCILRVFLVVLWALGAALFALLIYSFVKECKEGGSDA